MEATLQAALRLAPGSVAVPHVSGEHLCLSPIPKCSPGFDAKFWTVWSLDP